MLVSSERKLFVAELLQLTSQNKVRAAQEIQLVLVRGDSVQGFRQKIFEFDYVTLLRLQVFLMLDESFE
jgi:hypothetical protein